MTDRIDIEQRPSFEVIVWRSQAETPRAWGWTARIRGQAIGSATDPQLRATAREAFADGCARLAEVLRNRVDSAECDENLVVSGLELRTPCDPAGAATT